MTGEGRQGWRFATPCLLSYFQRPAQSVGDVGWWNVWWVWAGGVHIVEGVCNWVGLVTVGLVFWACHDMLVKSWRRRPERSTCLLPTVVYRLYIPRCVSPRVGLSDIQISTRSFQRQRLSMPLNKEHCSFRENRGWKKAEPGVMVCIPWVKCGNRSIGIYSLLFIFSLVFSFFSFLGGGVLWLL